MERKTVAGLELKGADKGEAVVRFATLGVVDLDGDIIAPGAIGRQRVKVSSYGHRSWGGELPVGAGETRESSNAAIADLRFFLDTQHGRDHWNTLKGLGDLAEYSFGFDVEDAADPSPEERKAGAKRVLKRLTVHEVSPVLRGAGIGTRTLSLKCSGCGSHISGAELEGQGRKVLEEARRNLDRAKEVLDKPIDRECLQYDRERQKAAEFAVYCGYILAGCPGDNLPPKVKWFPVREDANGFMLPGKHAVHLWAHLEPEAIVRTALHECYHHAQKDPRAPGAEGAAEAFAERWKAAVWAAYKATDGAGYRVRVSEERNPPFGGLHRAGDVVLQAYPSRAWKYTPQNINSWTKIG